MTMAAPHTLGCGWHRCLPCDCPTGEKLNRTHTRHISPYVPIVPIQGLERELAPVPNPMASFEDTTHAYECGYLDGIKAGRLNAPSNGDA